MEAHTHSSCGVLKLWVVLPSVSAEDVDGAEDGGDEEGKPVSIHVSFSCSSPQLCTPADFWLTKRKRQKPRPPAASRTARGQCRRPGA